MWTQREKHKEDIELVSVRTAENFKIAMLWIYGAFITFSVIISSPTFLHLYFQIGNKIIS